MPLTEQQIQFEHDWVKRWLEATRSLKAELWVEPFYAGKADLWRICIQTICVTSRSLNTPLNYLQMTRRFGDQTCLLWKASLLSALA